MERFFEHHHHHHDKDSNGNSNSDQSKARDQKPQQKESEMDKLRDYYHRDEELEEQGKTYGGLMWLLSFHAIFLTILNDICTYVKFVNSCMIEYSTWYC